MRTRKFVLLVIGILAMISLVGAVAAFMFMRTEIVSNELVPANVSCYVEENFNGTSKTSIIVSNTGTVDAYIRIRLVSYWVDGEGNIVDKPSEMPAVNPKNGWIMGSNYTYYYTEPVVSYGTQEFLGSSVTLKEEDGYKQVVEVFAEAIQAEPTDAAVGSWKVAINAYGEITYAP